MTGGPGFCQQQSRDRSKFKQEVRVILSVGWKDKQREKERWREEERGREGHERRSDM